MLKDQTIDEALIEIMRTKKALEALRKARKQGRKECWNGRTCVAARSPLPLDATDCPTCKGEVYLVIKDRIEHAAVKRASLDLTRKLADLRASR